MARTKKQRPHNKTDAINMRNTQTQFNDFNGKHYRNNYKTQPPQHLKHRKSTSSNKKTRLRCNKKAKRQLHKCNETITLSHAFQNRAALSCPSQTLKNAQKKKERLSASRYEFRVSCIIQGAPARPELRPKGGAPTSQGRACGQHTGHPKPAPRIRKTFFSLLGMAATTTTISTTATTTTTITNIYL